jgi:excisionase family DNA binding protein
MDIYKSIADLIEGQEKILNLLQNLSNNSTSTKIYDLVDLQNILHVSRRTIATWKSQGLLPYSQVGNKIFITQSDLDEFLKKYNVKTMNYGQ